MYLCITRASLCNNQEFPPSKATVTIEFLLSSNRPKTAGKLSLSLNVINVVQRSWQHTFTRLYCENVRRATECLLINENMSEITTSSLGRK